MQVWGGRTLERRDPAGRFVAHRRLIHRLVRAIRRVAEPLVFENNGPELWLALTRAVTTVLLEAFRAGALKGARPEEAFRVHCDDQTNPPEERDLGRCVCEIEVAPAVPMEFITLRVALSARRRAGGVRRDGATASQRTRFFVTLDPADAYLPAAQAALAAARRRRARSRRCSGLGAELEVMAYAEGGVNDFVHQLPVRHSWTRISLRRGVVRDSGAVVVVPGRPRAIARRAPRRRDLPADAGRRAGDVLDVPRRPRRQVDRARS